MIRVGFTVGGGQGWLGGANYIRNLLNAVCALPDRRIEPVILVSSQEAADALVGFPKTEVVRTPALMSSGLGASVRRRVEHLVGRDVFKERLLRARRIDVLSHSGHLGPRSTLPTIGWLADFQHRRMPEFFDAGERAARDQAFMRIAECCSTVIVSSLDARGDLAAFAPAALARCRVLHFVSGLQSGTAEPGEATLRAKHEITGPYFHLPNQFWAHKNHRIVIDALAILKSRGQAVTVVSTGHTQDRRRPDYFAGLMEHVRAQGVEAEFRVLGVVPYEDLAGLMRYSVAVINPSFFEGWSTTVEESKSMGKKILLSDLPVHREQAPSRGIYFQPKDAEGLAQAIWTARSQFASGAEAIHQAEALAQLPQRLEAFGREYESIVLDTIQKS